MSISKKGYRAKIICQVNEFDLIVNKIRNNTRKTIALLTGTFDLLHSGHLKYLIHAKKMASLLIVGVDCNEKVRRNKGNKRPIRDEIDRIELIAGFRPVDYAFLADDNFAAITIIKPDIYVVSKTTKMQQRKLEEIQHVERFGGIGVILDAQSTIHSSDMIETIKAL